MNKHNPWILSTHHVWRFHVNGTINWERLPIQRESVGRCNNIYECSLWSEKDTFCWKEIRQYDMSGWTLLDIIRHLSKKYLDRKVFRQFLRKQFRYYVSLVSYIVKTAFLIRRSAPSAHLTPLLYRRLPANCVRCLADCHCSRSGW